MLALQVRRERLELLVPLEPLEPQEMQVPLARKDQLVHRAFKDLQGRKVYRVSRE
jgi:hypothetical protein